MIEGEHGELRRLAARRRPVNVIEHRIEAQRPIELLALRKCWSPAMSASPARSHGATPRWRRRHCRSARRSRAPLLEIAAQEPGEERIAGAQHIIDLDGKPGAAIASSRSSGIACGTSCRPARPALEHDERRRDRADPPERRNRIGRAARNMDLLLGADDHRATAEDRLQMLGHHGIVDEAHLAGPMAAEPPQHRSVVDVENDSCLRRLGCRDRRQACF